MVMSGIVYRKRWGGIAKKVCCVEVGKISCFLNRSAEFLRVLRFHEKRRFQGSFFGSSMDFRQYFYEATIIERKL